MTKFITKETVVSLYVKQGLSLLDAAAEAGVSLPTFLRYMRLHKVPTRPPFKADRSRTAEIRKHRKGGASLAAIAEVYGLSRQRVHQILSQT